MNKDFIKCNNCGFIGLVNKNEDVCTSCKTIGTLEFSTEDVLEAMETIKDLMKKHHLRLRDLASEDQICIIWSIEDVFYLDTQHENGESEEIKSDLTIEEAREVLRRAKYDEDGVNQDVLDWHIDAVKRERK